MRYICFILAGLLFHIPSGYSSLPDIYKDEPLAITSPNTDSLEVWGKINTFATFYTQIEQDHTALVAHVQHTISTRPIAIVRYLTRTSKRLRNILAYIKKYEKIISLQLISAHDSDKLKGIESTISGYNLSCITIVDPTLLGLWLVVQPEKSKTSICYKKPDTPKRNFRVVHINKDQFGREQCLAHDPDLIEHCAQRLQKVLSAKQLNLHYIACLTNPTLSLPTHTYFVENIFALRGNSPYALYTNGVAECVVISIWNKLNNNRIMIHLTPNLVRHGLLWLQRFFQDNRAKNCVANLASGYISERLILFSKVLKTVHGCPIGKCTTYKAYCIATDKWPSYDHMYIVRDYRYGGPGSDHLLQVYLGPDGQYYTSFDRKFA
ncbi:MAG: hypothetical protein ACPGXY_00055 [Alphaproteobacteria bacterium]